MKIGLMLLILALSLILPSFGPHEAELRAELRSIDHERMLPRNAAFRLGCDGLQYCIFQSVGPLEGACRSIFLGYSGKAKNNKTKPTT
jgi:hypothetical protein